jgi:hypothetical protein
VCAVAFGFVMETGWRKFNAGINFTKLYFG